MSERFWSKVRVGDLSQCWPFQGARTGGRDGNTYGYVEAKPQKRMAYAHRFAFCLANGVHLNELGRDVVVRHACDNPICCNPMHLLLGSQADNARDMVDRGRSLRGEIATNVKLTEVDVHAIRRRLAAGEKQSSIAADFGVSRPNISLIASRRIWEWLTTPGLEAA